MKKKALILANILIILSLIFVYNFWEEKPVEISQNEITIFTRDPLLGVHAKMITASDGDVFIAPSTKLSKDEITKLNSSNVLLSSTSLSESDIASQLQNYTWLYVTIPPHDSNIQNRTLSPEALSSQIELVRDTLSDANPTQRWLYYDNAGNYIHLLNTTLNWFKTRIEKLKPTYFITIGDDLSNFLRILGIENYRVKNYENLSLFFSDKETQTLITENSVNSIFTSISINEADARKIRKEYPNITLYKIPELADDTSRWWYIRLVEKIMNNFVADFDTYD
jgi:ABC-type Zn uptake system ZnuABC Zn-binding protein ZnuA